MVFALSIFFSAAMAPHELAGDDDAHMTPIQRLKKYRDAAGWALTRGKYTSPGSDT